MNKANTEPVLVVVQLSGGNDYMNTVIPFSNPSYYDNRPLLKIEEENVLRINNQIGFHPTMAPLHDIYNNGEMAVIHGVGWQGSNRSHFRAMDIWHTADPDTFATQGWLGKATSQIDPNGDNPVTAVNIGYGLPRALVAEGVSVAAVSDINSYGLLSSIAQQDARTQMLGRFAKMYAPANGRGPIIDYIAKTGMDSLNGADLIGIAPELYTSEVEYGPSTIAHRLRDIAMIHLAGIGARVLYTEYGGFDTHAAQATNHPRLWGNVASAISEFWSDLKSHNAADNVVMLVFSEFGRRVRENGGGTDHGAAGVAFMIGPKVQGGLYGEYPSIEADHLIEGDLATTMDFRDLYSSIIVDWMGLDDREILKGQFEKPALFAN